MSTYTEHTENFETYLCMRTWYKWLLLFEIANFYDVVYNRSGHLTALGDYLWGYVIVPSYLHVLLCPGHGSWVEKSQR